MNREELISQSESYIRRLLKERIPSQARVYLYCLSGAHGASHILCELRLAVGPHQEHGVVVARQQIYGVAMVIEAEDFSDDRGTWFGVVGGYLPAMTTLKPSR
jgi:hypothetical protein